MYQPLAVIAAASGFIAVALGAFGAHGLKSRVAADAITTWETAVSYQFYHTLALLMVATLPLFQGSRAALAAGWLFVAGMLFFSGSLYTLVLSDIRALGAVAPVGGVLLLAGWVMLLLAFVGR